MFWDDLEYYYSAFDTNSLLEMFESIVEDDKKMAIYNVLEQRDSSELKSKIDNLFLQKIVGEELVEE